MGFFSRKGVKSMLLAALCVSDAAAAASLSDHAWHHRVLLVFASSDASPELAVQRANIDRSKRDFNDRDLRSIVVSGNTVKGSTDTAADLRRRFNIHADAFRVLLIGKDGGVKMNSARPLSSNELNATIDAMPMRREEMRTRQ
jgi:hypothetical protein